MKTCAAPSGACPVRIAESPEGLPEARAEPAFRLRERHSPAGGVVLDLVARDPAHREVLRLRMVEVDATDCGGGEHGVALGQREADRLRAEQLEQLSLFTVVGAGGVAERRPDAAEVLLE